MNNTKKFLYLDNSATTQPDIKVIKKLSNFLKSNYGNPSSQHSLGKIAREEIEEAKKQIAKSINAKREEIIFTSGGTESNNFVLKGLTDFYKQAKNKRNHIITSEFEHPAILATCKYLEKNGFKTTYIKPDKEGIINPKDIENTIIKSKGKTLIVSIMHVNNEIGTIQPIKEIGNICRKHKVYFHTDAVQSYLKEKIDVKKQNIDFLSVSGHKINAPKGVGFLYIREKYKERIIPQIHGGGQQDNIRSGTENTNGIISLAETLKIKRNLRQTRKNRDYLIKKLKEIPKTKINGSIKKNKRVCHNVNVSFYGIEGESLMLMLDKKNIQVSTGSACSSNKLQKSHVLTSINNQDKKKEGKDDLYINGSIRITLDTRKDKQLTAKDLDYIIDSIKSSVNKLRKISPFKIDEELNTTKARNKNEKTDKQKRKDNEDCHFC